ncbi:HAD family hydrolase [Deinococcus navajonensis]|uniref:HAD family hydrolase n=1 Tax=Deinococcus navajonensis TaxID=309884 RepID=A0ABV8XPW4_9DEIO
MFDLNGTLHDRTATLRHWLADPVRRFGLPAGYVQRFLEEDDYGYRSKRVVFPRLIQEFGLSVTYEELYNDDHRALYYARAMPDAQAVLIALRHRGQRLGIVINGWTQAEQTCAERCGLMALGDDLVISRAVGYAKPDHRIFELAMKRLGATPETTWFVGDSPRNDILGALGNVRPDWVLNGLLALLHLPGGVLERPASSPGENADSPGSGLG